MEPTELIEIEANRAMYRLPGAQLLEIGGAASLAQPALPSARMLNRTVGITSQTSDADLDRLEAFFSELGVDYQLSPSEPGLEGRLETRGLVPGYAWMKFRRGTQPHRAETDLRLERIGRDQAGTFARVVRETWHMPPELDEWIASTVGLPGWTCYVTFDGDEPAGAAVLVVSDGAGWLGFGSTLPAYRGRGSQGALFAARIADAAALGARLLVTETGVPTEDGPGPSYRNILRAGFEEAYTRPNYVRP